MTGTVSTASIVFMAVSCAVSFAIPVVLLLYFRLKKHADILPFFVGCLVMLVFALVLESIVHRLVLGSSAGDAIRNDPWLYALYGGLMAGLFEETGRFAAFRTVLKKKQGKNSNALMYGAGHGGFEAAAMVGMTMINNIIWSVLINSGQMSLLTGPLSGDLLKQVEDSIRELLTTPPYQFLMGGVERIFAVALQIALSVLVWFAVKNRRRRYLYPVAILLHFAVDAVTAVLSGYNAPVVLIEVAVAVITVVYVLIAKKVWDRETASENTADGAAFVQ